MKTEHNPNIDELLVKSMLDEASVAEQIEIKQWLLDDDDNQRYFRTFRTHLERKQTHGAHEYRG